MKALTWLVAASLIYASPDAAEPDEETVAVPRSVADELQKEIDRYRQANDFLAKELMEAEKKVKSLQAKTNCT